MRSRNPVVGLVVLAVLAASLSVYATAATPPTTTQTAPPPPPPTRPASADCGVVGNHNIEVGSTVDCKWAPLHTNAKGNGNLVNWQSTVSGMNVKIVFDSSPFQSPLNCDGTQNVCHSGPLRASITGDPPAPFTYHAYLCDKDKNCGSEIDPGIIVVP